MAYKADDKERKNHAVHWHKMSTALRWLIYDVIINEASLGQELRGTSLQSNAKYR